MITFTHFFQAFDKFGKLLKLNKRCKYDDIDHALFNCAFVTKYLFCNSIFSGCTLTPKITMRTLLVLYYDPRSIRKNN